VNRCEGATEVDEFDQLVRHRSVVSTGLRMYQQEPNER
jgi:hypothetical protein